MKCTKCGLIKQSNGKFKPSVGKELDNYSAYNLVCQYNTEDKIACLNQVTKFNPEGDTWEKRNTVI
jgi:hypothetical protein